MTIAIVDIGSNSVRLVVYEGVARAPAVLFNEKVTSGLGRGVATSGRLPAEGVASALAALMRFGALCRIMQVEDVIGVATAAARDANNGAEFIARAEAALGAPVAMLYGPSEARLAALGVVSGVHRADGVVGDLGGGSLELTEIVDGQPAAGLSLPLGSLTLADRSERDPQKALRLASDALDGSAALSRLSGRDFYAVGGAWRALARLHMRANGYPLEIIHNYVLPADPQFVRLAARAATERPEDLRGMPSARRAALGYGAAVLDAILRRGGPRRVVVSAFGVREGLIYDRLAAERRAEDPLLAAARALNQAHARDPLHAEELFAWTSGLLAQRPHEESDDERRLRHAACLLADVGWRTHPDHRAETAFSMIVYANLTGLDHGERVALALAAAGRHVSSVDVLTHSARALLSPRQAERAQALASAMRVAFVLSAGRAGVLARTPLTLEGGQIVLELPGDLGALKNERLVNRLRPLTRAFGAEATIRLAGQLETSKP